MGISLEAYRSSIGRFIPTKHLKIYKKQDFYYETENYPTDLSRIRKYLFLLFILLAPVMLAIVTMSPMHSSSQAYSHPLYPDSCSAGYSHTQLSSYLSTRSGNVTTDMAATYVLQYGVNTLSASAFSMITNFKSRYTNGNRRNSGIKISH